MIFARAVSVEIQGQKSDWGFTQSDKTLLEANNSVLQKANGLTSLSLFYVCWLWFSVITSLCPHSPVAISHWQSLCLTCSNINLVQTSSIYLWVLFKSAKLPELFICLVCFCDNKLEAAGRHLWGSQHVKKDTLLLRRHQYHKEKSAWNVWHQRTQPLIPPTNYSQKFRNLHVLCFAFLCTYFTIEIFTCTVYFSLPFCELVVLDLYTRQHFTPWFIVQLHWAWNWHIKFLWEFIPKR